MQERKEILTLLFAEIIASNSIVTFVRLVIGVQVVITPTEEAITYLKKKA